MRPAVSFIALCVLAGSPAVLADDVVSNDAEAPPTIDSDDAIEEIEVLGELPTIQLGKIVEKARLDFWDLYNSLNDVAEFRVVCDRRDTTGTRFRELSCVPAYYSQMATELTNQQSLSTVRSGGTARGLGARPPNQRNFVRQAQKKKEEADAHMIALIEAHPELREKYEYLRESTEAYERSKESE